MRFRDFLNESASNLVSINSNKKLLDTLKRITIDQNSDALDVRNKIIEDIYSFASFKEIGYYNDSDEIDVYVNAKGNKSSYSSWFVNSLTNIIKSRDYNEKAKIDVRRYDDRAEIFINCSISGQKDNCKFLVFFMDA